MLPGIAPVIAGAGLPPPPTRGADCTLLLHGDGTNGSTTFTDSSSSGLAATRNGTVSISTAQSKFGGSSILFNGGYLQYSAPAALAFGTGDFTFDMWVRATAINSSMILIDTRPASTHNTSYWIIYLASGKATFLSSAHSVTSTTTFVANNWYHIAVTRSAGTVRLFINGVLEATTASFTENFLAAASRPIVGAEGYTLGANAWSGYIDELRVRKGTAEWTANFLPFTQPYA